MKKKSFVIEMEFEDLDLAKDFVAYWLDGGGEYNFWWISENDEYFHTETNWHKKPGKIIKKFKLGRTDSPADG